ncbi:restriction endonuclease subunit S [Mycobacteroides chelonae]|uniref:Type I restriction modification DNA specificity domain-containing protein n=1 Tax=Mycobacteroides chelonae TaxID=1774 RepID=A0AB73U5U3_MYCCH|nr:restriction endonuclease subunit S [Mycobacteroides chelonae]MEC4841100.1 restriction endonuclease subunit S [Mycobacteroides chelonae]MEC4842768.1 restriction endonuclease subunit S [Mycobacteroides chelonae]OLT73197.1 hypothetical protein BKG57_22175 [Mycobacteroides chelonae]QDF71820.1 hypothetical protein FJK96_17780 [Mycobacteroides chelonae]WED92096.1 restriction endonuclease subunit S [Mycobacteroides chelonae]
MNWPAYPAYTDEGVSWLDKYPAGWTPTPLKLLATMKNGDSITSEAIEDSGEYPVYGGNGLRGFTARYTHQGERVLIGRQGALCGNIHLVSGQYWASEHAIVTTPEPATSARWLAYALRVMDLGQYSQAAAQPGIAADVIGKLRVPTPPKGEQNGIADFLDSETAKIDALIAKQEQLIATLQERRGAVADRLLNKPGLTQPLKRSVANVTVGIVVTPSAWYAEEGVPALRGLNIRPGLVTSDDLVYLTPEGDALHAKSRLGAGDVVMVRTGQAGSAAVIPTELSGANAIDLLIIRPGPKVDPEFISAYLNAPSIREKIAHGSVGAIQGHFNVSALRELGFPSIDMAEQRHRAEEWRIQEVKIDALIVKTETFIELSREYRSALITDAVTGKIDVRRAA